MRRLPFPFLIPSLLNVDYIALVGLTFSAVFRTPIHGGLLTEAVTHLKSSAPWATYLVSVCNARGRRARTQPKVFFPCLWCVFPLLVVFRWSAKTCQSWSWLVFQIMYAFPLGAKQTQDQTDKQKYSSEYRMDRVLSSPLL